MVAITLQRGYTFQEGEKIEAAKLNQLGAPAVNVVGALTSAAIGTGAVNTVHLATDAVTTPKILDLNVTTGKLADGAATTVKVADDAITPPKLDPTAQFAINGESRGLMANWVNSTTVRIRCDEIILKTSGGDCVILGSVDETIDITADGAGGLDTGEPAAGWYYHWLIYNPTTSDVAGLLSTSASAPTLPSGYTYRALIGAVRRNSSNLFEQFLQRGRNVVVPWTSLFTAKTLTSATWTAWGDTAADAANTVAPPIATRLHAVLGASTAASTPPCAAIATFLPGSGMSALGAQAVVVALSDKVLYSLKAGVPVSVMLPLQTERSGSSIFEWVLYLTCTDNTANYGMAAVGYDL